jgi:putative ABC transport system permease protein
VNFFIEIKEGLNIAWDAIRANKMRSVLTTLGIIIGIVTVTAMGTAIDALNRAFRDSISILGADVLFVSHYTWAISRADKPTRSNNRCHWPRLCHRSSA